MQVTRTYKLAFDDETEKNAVLSALDSYGQLVRDALVLRSLIAEGEPLMYADLDDLRVYLIRVLKSEIEEPGTGPVLDEIATALERFRVV